MYWVIIHSHWLIRWTRSLSWVKSTDLSVLCAMFCNMFHLIVMVMIQKINHILHFQCLTLFHSDCFCTREWFVVPFSLSLSIDFSFLSKGF